MTKLGDSAIVFPWNPEVIPSISPYGLLYFFSESLKWTTKRFFGVPPIALIDLIKGT